MDSDKNILFWGQNISPVNKHAQTEHWPYVMSRCNAFDMDTDAEGNDSSDKSRLHLIYRLNNII